MSEIKRIPWRRYWQPIGSHIRLLDNGFLTDPETLTGRSLNTQLAATETLIEDPCLVLLGEPGTGKSTELELLEDMTRSAPANQSAQIHRVNLGEYQSEQGISEAITANERFEAWQSNGGRLFLFLDALDEGMLRVDTISKLILRNIDRGPANRLSLRITCRTAAWPLGLEDSLKSIYGKDAVRIHELAPLRRADVAQAAQVHGLDPESFIDAVENADVVPLASRPVTMRLLLNRFKQNGTLPDSQTALYREGCELLCSEVNQDRLDAGQTGSLDPRQRLTIASRIAAILVFTNRIAIWADVDWGDVPEEHIAISELADGDESLNGVTASVTGNTIKETLDTGLFAAHGSGAFRFAHQSYAEFLAADYVAKPGIQFPQIMTLITHPGDSDGRIVPQLRQTVAWLSSMRSDVFKTILQVDPGLLLDSDMVSASPPQREQLVDALLSKYEKGHLPSRGYGIRFLYQRLNHPEIAEQLRPFITDKNRNIYARKEAVEIAGACDVIAVQDELVTIALDQSEPEHLRTAAAAAVASGGNNEAKARFLPLAQDDAGDDPVDELKGYGLEAVWSSKTVTLPEILEMLRPPRMDLFLGGYDRFIRYVLPESLSTSDLPMALEWVSRQPSRHELHRSLHTLMDAILLKGWEHIDNDEVADRFVDAVWSRLEHYDELLEPPIIGEDQPDIFDDDDQRRQVLTELVHRFDDPESHVDRLLYPGNGPLRRHDISWLIEQSQAESCLKYRRAWLRLVRRLVDWNDASDMNLVLRTAQQDSEVAEAFDDPLRAVCLDSNEAHQLREKDRQFREITEGRREPPLLDPPPDARVRNVLDMLENGEFEAWWSSLHRELSLRPDSTHYDGAAEAKPDITSLPGWEAADTETRSRIVRAAIDYILRGDPGNEKWLDSQLSLNWRPAAGGYRAFHLLARAAPDELETLEADIWGKWAAAIVDFPVFGSTEHDENVEIQRQLIQNLHDNALNDLLDAIIRIMDRDIATGGGASVLRTVREYWNDKLAEAVESRITSGEVAPKDLAEVLNMVHEYDPVRANASAVRLVAGREDEHGDGRERSIYGATFLLSRGGDKVWDQVWPLLADDPEYGREVMFALVNRGDRFLASLSELRLAELYCWLVDIFPDATLTGPGGSVTPLERVAWLRDGIVGELESRGTVMACRALTSMIERVPDHARLPQALEDARDQMLRVTWKPLAVPDFLALARDPDKRLVENADQLLQVIGESLDRLQRRLHGTTPVVIFLWNQWKFDQKWRYRPKEEEAISDFVKDHLEQDLKQRGIVLNREVEIRRRPAASPGQRTDILVEAVVPHGNARAYDRAAVIIEVKGDWHQALNTAMKDQLLDRYLYENECTHGLYLVGRFYCEGWDDDDQRKSNAPMDSLEDLRIQFSAQASGLSDGDRTIAAYVLDMRLK